ncbi:homocysteine S-methyltransferase [Apilactobacillus apisilvae]|uniref:Homocysteine S-methyltransferase n=1 Tax=Apilactobacillus apisilvae TaxID=2923364 RepID=A0ABY4PFR3_9LACO|nr:homocysteine S-methyltransferase [Apilactobacillus apisilvae]UQS84427.1 homocysteine S-methyltransferase [Apilactobacillus apisilvae]
MNKFELWAKNQKHILMDSSMSTGLEERGLNLNDKLWTARALDQYPKLVEEVHQAYFNAGSTLTTIDTYQASIKGLTSHGYNHEQACNLIQKAFNLAKDAQKQVSKKAWLAAGIGPYGAFLANGSEYTGDYQLSEKEYVDFHKERIEILVKLGVDVLLLETLPNFAEIKALVKFTKQFTVPSIVACSMKDANHLADGTNIKVVQAFLEKQNNVIVYGLNCTDPKIVTPALKNLINNYPNHKDLIAFPNSGATYNPEIKE